MALIAVRGMLARRRITDWWNVSSATCLCAWQAKGAASAAAAKQDLTGNGKHLTGADPTWAVGTGWSSYESFDEFEDLLSNNNSFVWCGKLNATGSQSAFHNTSANWAGMVIHAHSSNRIYAGYNATLTPRITFSGYTSLTFGAMAYTKQSSDNEQKFYYDGDLEVTKTGDAPTNNDLIVHTGTECVGAAIYSGVLSADDVKTLSDYLLDL